MFHEARESGRRRAARAAWQHGDVVLRPTSNCSVELCSQGDHKGGEIASWAEEEVFWQQLPRSLPKAQNVCGAPRARGVTPAVELI